MVGALNACAALPESVTVRDAASGLAVPERFAAALPDAQDEGSSAIVDGLLALFDDASLNALVERALRRNLDIAVAARRMEEAGYQADAGRGAMVPGVDGSVSASRARGVDGDIAATYSPSLDVSWEPDIWGRLRDRKGALDETLAARVEDLQAARDSIAAQVMQAWFDAVTAERQVLLEEARLANLEMSAANSRLLFQAGLAVLEDVTVVERDIAQTRATLAERRRLRNAHARTVQTLLGEYPSGVLTEEAFLPPLVARPRPGIPASVLTNRPDIRAAWRNVLAADSSVRVAHKEQFPSFSLTASLGQQGSSLAGLFSGATIWSMATSLAVPVFNADKLKSNVFAAQSRAEQAWLDYQIVALRAFREVEQALDQEALLAEREDRQQVAVDRAEETARIFESRYRQGLVSVLEFLAAQNTVFDLESQLLDIRNQRLKNRVALALALGIGV